MEDDMDDFKFEVTSPKISSGGPLYNSRLDEIEEEALKLKSLQDSYNKDDTNDNSSIVEFSDATAASTAAATDLDSRSIYVGNVDYSSTANEIEEHFAAFGKINRITIQCDKFTRQPKGFCYIEFASSDSVDNAITLSDTLFKGRLIKVLPKRTNIPGISTTNRGSRGRGRGRGRGFRGRGRFSRYNRFRRGPY